MTLSMHPRVSYDFSDRVVVVTGASRGIGAAIALSFAAAGADLVVHGRDLEALQTTIDAAAELGRRAVAVTGNIRDPETARALADTTLATYGRADILVNNAGGNFAKRIEEMSANAWNATIETNLGGPFHCSKAFHPIFVRAGGGVIVNMGSASGAYAHPLRAAYAAAKAGLVSLTKTMAWEWADDHIRVNCIAPGAVLTERSRFATPETAERISQYIPMNRLGTGQDIADACLFLASDGAAYITGETLTVRGGPLTSSPADVEMVRALA